MSSPTAKPPGPAAAPLPKGLVTALEAAASRHTLTGPQLESARRQAESLLQMDPAMIEGWGSQALEQHEECARQVATLRDHINEAGIGDILARASAVPGAAATASSPASLKGLLGDLVRKRPPDVKLDLDAESDRAKKAQLLARGFLAEIDAASPPCTQGSERLAILLTSIEAVAEYAQDAPPGAGTQLKVDRLAVRQDILARALIQSGILTKTLDVLRGNVTAWIDQAEYIRSVLIPARRLAKE